MFAALFLLQSSLLVAPLTPGAAPPETRAIAAVRFGENNASSRYDLATPEKWRARAKSGDDFLAFARACAIKPSPVGTGLVGTYWKASLAQDTADFLFNAAVGDVNEYVVAEDVDHRPLVAVRLERDAACRQIFVAGTDDRARAAADGILRALRAGADFAALARERSDDRASALRGGDFAIFERGRNDALLREAAFKLKVGEISGVIASPLGFHILQRAEVSALDPRLRDDVWAHARGIVIAFDGARGADPALRRDHDEAERIANDLAARILRGEDMVALAKEFNEDGRGEHSGRARAGDLGWVRRGTTAMPQFMDRLFTDVPGTLIGPIATEAGYVLVRREDPGPRSRIDLRKSSFVEFENWIGARNAGSKEVTTDPALDRAVHARNALYSPLRDHVEVILEPVVRSANSADFLTLCSSLPEVQKFSGETEIALRTLAVEYAKSLAPLEASYLANIWPRREHELDVALAALKVQLAPLGDVALDQIMRDFSMSDPMRVVRVCVTGADSTDGYPAYGHLSGGTIFRSAGNGEVCLVNIAELSGLDLLQAVLHWSTGVLDIATHEQQTLLSDLRQRLGSVDGTWQVELHALIAAECADVVRRVFDEKFSQSRYAVGWNTLGDRRMFGSNTPKLESTSERGQKVSAVTSAWNSFLAGKTTRAEALDAIVAAAKSAK